MVWLAATATRCQLLKRKLLMGFPPLCRTRNPGTNPSTSWAGLFTFTGGKLTTGPVGAPCLAAVLAFLA